VLTTSLSMALLLTAPSDGGRGLAATQGVPSIGVPKLTTREPTAEELVATALACDTPRIEPGTPFRLAVRFDLRPDWHLYWRNPGESGAPPTVRLRLPEGFVAGPMEWPRPIVHAADGEETTFLFERSLILFVPVTPPPTLPSVATVEADLGWMVCKGKCLVGKRTVALELPLAAERPVDPAVIAARAALPVAAASLAIETTLEGSGDTLALVLSGPAPTGSAIGFLPDVTPGVTYAGGAAVPPGVTADGGRFILRLPLDVRPGNSLGQPLRAAGLLTIDPPGGGAGRSAEIAVPLARPDGA
jgi:DsbC/DsbD-like thiol-disulfide interchange protein